MCVSQGSNSRTQQQTMSTLFAVSPYPRPQVPHLPRSFSSVLTVLLNGPTPPFFYPLPFLPRCCGESQLGHISVASPLIHGVPWLLILTLSVVVTRPGLSSWSLQYSQRFPVISSGSVGQALDALMSLCWATGGGTPQLTLC